MNIVSSIVSKKQNLSYPLVFSKISKYYWNGEKIEKFFRMDIEDIIHHSINNKWYRVLKAMACMNEYIFRSAVFHNHLDTVKYLVENGFDFHFDNEDALCTACSRGYYNIVKYLIEKGANIHSRDDDPFRSAIFYEHLDIAKYLIEKGANVKNEYALRIVCARGYLDFAKYLIEKGADIHDDPPLWIGKIKTKT